MHENPFQAKLERAHQSVFCRWTTLYYLTLPVPTRARPARAPKLQNIRHPNRLDCDLPPGLPPVRSSRPRVPARQFFYHRPADTRPPVAPLAGPKPRNTYVQLTIVTPTGDIIFTPSSKRNNLVSEVAPPLRRHPSARPSRTYPHIPPSSFARLPPNLTPPAPEFPHLCRVLTTLRASYRHRPPWAGLTFAVSCLSCLSRRVVQRCSPMTPSHDRASP